MSIIPFRRLLLTSPLPPISAPSPGLSLNHTTTIPSNPSLKISSSTSSANFDQGSSFSSNFNGPYMGVILVVLLVTFFLMAFFSVYIRRFAFSIGSDLAGDGMPDWARAERMQGLDRTLIDRLPIVVYHCVEEGKKQAIKGDSQEVSKAESDVTPTTTKMKGASKDAAGATVHAWRQRPDCVVCLTDFEEDENVRLLPKCEHCFHPECIDMWLFSHTTCPLCRRSLLPVPTAASASLQMAPSPSASAVTGLDPPIPLGARPNSDVCIDVQEGTSHLDNTTQQGASMGDSMQESDPS